MPSPPSTSRVAPTPSACRVKSSLFRHVFIYVFHWVFVGQACQSKAETFSFLKSKVPTHPIVFELQAKARRNVLDTDEGDADWLLGGAKVEPIYWRCRIYLKARPRVHIGIA